MAGVVGMAGEDGGCPIKLLGEDYAGEGVGERHGAEREEERCAFARGVRPSVGWSDGEDYLLGCCFALFAKPLSEGFRRHLSASAVEEDGEGRSAALLAIDPVKERIFSAERLLFAASECGAALEVHGSELIEGIP